MQCQKERYAQLWRLNCEQLEEFDKTLEDKEDQIGSLLEKIQQLKARTQHSATNCPLYTASATTLKPSAKAPAMNVGRRGKTPLVNSFRVISLTSLLITCCPHLRELLRGMRGSKKSSCCSLWGTYGEELSKSGISLVRIITTGTPQQ